MTPPPVSARVNICFSLSLFSVLTSDCIELDFKEISYLVLCFQWEVDEIVSSSPTYFHSEKIGLIRVTYDPPVSIRVNKYYSDLYSSVIHHKNRQLKPY